MRRHVIEIYTTVMSTVRERLANLRSVYDIPFLSVTIDLITAKLSNEKYLGIRVSGLLRGHMQSYLIAVRSYKPLIGELRDHQASERLVRWTAAIMIEVMSTSSGTF